VNRHPLKDIYVPVYAGEYTACECAGRDKYVIDGKEYEECAFCRASCPSRDDFKEPDSGLPLKCDMCEGEDEPLCVKWCLVDALTYEEREEEVEEEESPEEMEVGLEALANEYGLDKIMETVARMSASKKGRLKIFSCQLTRGLRKTVESVADYKEIIDVIKESGGDAFKRCFQCGLCDTVCPWNRVRSFSMRKLVRQATFGFTEIESEEMWLCTTCGRCPQHCPRDVQQIESGVALRRVATEYGVFPAFRQTHSNRQVEASSAKATLLGEERKTEGNGQKVNRSKHFPKRWKFSISPAATPVLIREPKRSPRPRQKS
jgi:benzoyl-CoA reductase subunit BamC